MASYVVRHHGTTDRFGLAAALEAFASEQWVGDHYTPEQAAAAVLDRFARAVAQEMELIELIPIEPKAAD